MPAKMRKHDRHRCCGVTDLQAVRRGGTHTHNYMTESKQPLQHISAEPTLLPTATWRGMTRPHDIQKSDFYRLSQESDFHLTAYLIPVVHHLALDLTNL